MIDPKTTAGQGHMAAVRLRQDEIQERISDFVEPLLRDRRKPLDEARLMEVAVNARGSTQKVMWLRRAAGRLTASLSDSGISSCRKGCNHCCHIPVALQEAEARVIAKDAGLVLKEPAALMNAGSESDRQSEQDSYRSRWDGTPCPMLSKDGDCTIYEHRPLACRIHRNTDVDDLLCRLVQDIPVSVPYIDTREHVIGRLRALGTERFADIREWFDPA